MKKNLLIAGLLLFNIFFIFENNDLIINKLKAGDRTENGFLEPDTYKLMWLVHTGTTNASGYTTTYSSGLSSFTILSVYVSINYSGNTYYATDFGDSNDDNDYNVTFNNSNGNITINVFEDDMRGKNYRMLIFYK